MRNNNFRSTCLLSKVALYCFLIAIASLLLFCFFLLMGIDLGHFIAISMFMFIAAPLLAIISIIVITIRIKKLKGYLLSIMVVLMSIPPGYVLYSVQLGVRARGEFEKSTSAYYMKRLGKALIEYAKDHNGYLPTAERWCDELINYDNRLCKYYFLHPDYNELNLRGDCSYAFNKNLSGLRLTDISDRSILLFEAEGEWNLCGAAELIKKRNKNHYYVELLTVDQSMADYRFDEKTIRKFSKNGKNMYYKKPRWNP